MESKISSGKSLLTGEPINLHLLNYILHLADNALILGHRNSEWTGHGPILEQDIAISNIALDLVGQSRYLYQYAASIAGQNHTEDTLAFLRDAIDFKNCALVEQPNGDWAMTITRQFFFSQFQFYYYNKLKKLADEQLAGIAEKSLLEVKYHLEWSSEWVIRLGDGTEESNRRMRSAIGSLWKFTGELFQPASYEAILADLNLAVDPQTIKKDWSNAVKQILEEAMLSDAIPAADSAAPVFGKEGLHTEALGFLLAEMQFMQRAYPNSTW